LFASDPETVRYATNFARVYGLAGGVLVAFPALSGGRQGASETRIPFAARMTGMFGLFLGLSWLLGETLGFGPVGAYAGVVAAYAWMALVVMWGLERSDGAGRAAETMAERGRAS
jgi:Na+-driven multidrug efflux pump